MPRLLAVSRSAVYRKPAEVNAADLAMMALIDRQYLARPYYGSRRMAAWLATQGHVVNRKRVRRLMRLLGLVAIYPRPNTSKPAAAHKIYPQAFRSGGTESSNPASSSGESSTNLEAKSPPRLWRGHAPPNRLALLVFGHFRSAATKAKLKAKHRRQRARATG
jgi:putative transposase